MSEDLVARLVAAGMSVAEAEGKARLFLRAESAIGAGHSEGLSRWFVPGRIEVLGKHTDYAGGRSLLCAVERGMCVVAAPRQDDVVRMTDVANRETAECSVLADLTVPASGWLAYPATVIRRVRRNFSGPLRGAEIAFASDLPSSAGMSSSSVLVVATFTALSHINHLAERTEYVANLPRLEDLAGYLGSVENGTAYGSLSGDHGVGTFGGSEDHTAILCARPGWLVQYRFCPVRWEGAVPLFPDCTFAVAASGVTAEKTGPARELYNRMTEAASSVLECWRATTGRDDASLFAAVTSSDDAPQRLHQMLAQSAGGNSQSDPLLARCEQFVEETLVLIPRAYAALSCGDLGEFGQIVDRSQRAAEGLLRNQVPETIELARSARLLGAHAASAFGAGFGGSVWALVSRRECESFLERWQKSYRKRFPEAAMRAGFFATCAGPSLMHL